MFRFLINTYFVLFSYHLESCFGINVIDVDAYFMGFPLLLFSRILSIFFDFIGLEA